MNPYHRAMARRLVSPVLVGREPELGSIRRLLERAVVGSPIHQLVAGEAGVGKSRLVEEAASLARTRGLRVISGGCADIGDGGVPYGPIVQALRALARDLDSEDLATAFGPSIPELARLIPSLGSPADQDEAVQTNTAHARMLDAVLATVQRLASLGPILFIVEDLHWADPATRETIAFLIREMPTDRIAFLMTFRADELHRRHPLLPWLAEMARSGRVERLDLERLTVDQTGDLLAAILDERPSRDVAERIHRRSDGNPFFIEELVGAGQDGETRIPPTLREVLLARIVELPEAAQAVVGAAAVAGRPVDHALLAVVTAMDDSTFLDALRTAIASQVLVTGGSTDDPDGDYTFRHALFQEAAYDDLLPGERQMLHRRFAEALAARGPGSGAMAAGHWAQLAYHWSSARDERHAFEASVRAGEAAARAFAFADARRHDERALELWSAVDDPVGLSGMDRVALLDRAAVAVWLMGDSRRSVALRREAVAELGPAGDPIRRGVMLEQLGRILWADGDANAALEACEAAISIMPTKPPSSERARVLAGYGQLLMLLDRWSESMVHCERAIAMARDVGGLQPEGHALNTLGLCLAHAGRCSEATSALARSLEIAREISDADDIGRAYVNFTEARLQCGDTRGAADLVRDGVTVTDAMGLTRTYSRFIRENGIGYNYDLGDWDEADRLAAGSVATLVSGRAQRRYGLVHWVPLLVSRGDPSAEERLAECRDLLEGYPVESQFNVPYRLAASEAALWRGAPDEALRHAVDGIDEVADKLWPRYLLRLYRMGLRAASDLADVARARRDEQAERSALAAGTDLWNRLPPILDEMAPRLAGQSAAERDAEQATMTAEYRRLTGDRASDAWSAAAAQWRARENAYLVAYCRWREGEGRLSEGDRTSAREALADAHAIAARLGARPLGSAIEGLARRSRIDLETIAPTPAPSDDANPFHLTPRELEVLPLLVQGRTNREIGETLFISENTAGVHVSNILGKLGVSSRTEAAGVAVRLGVGDS
jgi:DNA-binding CsgD family transcriptional regulator/tetratricopeptide (TPR) repeat protein